jgi:hypothetical protein
MTSLMIQALSAPKPSKIRHCLAWGFLGDSQTSLPMTVPARFALQIFDCGAAEGGHLH